MAITRSATTTTTATAKLYSPYPLLSQPSAPARAGGSFLYLLSHHRNEAQTGSPVTELHLFESIAELGERLLSLDVGEFGKVVEIGLFLGVPVLECA